MAAERDGTAWLTSVSRRRTAQIRADRERRSATVEQQEAAARQITDVIGILAAADPMLARTVALRIQHGRAAAVPEWPIPDDPLSLVYRLDVQMSDGPMTLARISWQAFRLTLDQVNAEYQARS